MKLNNMVQSYFMSQPWVYALKDSKHFRQTFLLDPIAQIFLYDFVYRNREYFEQKNYSNRESFGYTFQGDAYPSQSKEYKRFSVRRDSLKSQYNYVGKIDISNFFNNIYHHDIVSYIARIINQTEAEKLGKFLREINEGRSTSCFPQGLFPVKVIGSSFLSFIEASREINCEYIIRFMDDIYLFSNKEETILNDIFYIQKLIGEKGLHLNEEKTEIIYRNEETNESIESIKVSLLQKRRLIINSYSDSDDLDDREEEELTEQESIFLKEMLHEKNIEDEDIELILSLLTTTESETIELTRLVLYRSPQFIKNLYYNIKRSYMTLSEDIIDEFEIYLNKDYIPEYSLFWITKILIDFTELNELIANILINVYKHSSITNVTKCLILELQENNYGFLELKKHVARGHAPELIISAMTGLISHEKGNRNQIYKYVGKSNSMLRTITIALSTMDLDAFESLSSDLEENEYHRYNYSKQSSEEVKGTSNEYDISDDDLPF
ncbi:RNA-directed DNA polymerase [Paenibacillus sp. PsM32]|uniref:RNA-directed DNA polymerase n=1 Tax=Paenibacillus sp. PsM32 TaxID=3030536 RepID=UPI00263A6CF7|nr:RNA-directed DNA polymerase [Paenibacillus sp. PsM32]MDN4619290.1 RNA-directed DNA polymerase [Paenibacillus sp. PsM32]